MTKVAQVETVKDDIGIVYVLTNDAMPGMIKIGKTTGNVKDRMSSLYTTSVPLPFMCHYAKKFINHSAIEKNMHDVFSDKRVNRNREFFEVDPERVVNALQFIPGEDIITVDELNENLDKYDKIAVNKTKNKSRRNNINLTKILNIDDIIYFSRDKSIIATIVSSTEINFNGEITSLSNSATKLLQSSPVQGSIYWMFDGETLDERRTRMESENSE